MSIVAPRAKQLIILQLNENNLLSDMPHDGRIWNGATLSSPVSALTHRFGDLKWFQAHRTGRIAIRDSFFQLRMDVWRKLHFRLRHFAASSVFGVKPERRRYIYKHLESLSRERKAQHRTKELRHYADRLSGLGLRYLDQNLSILIRTAEFIREQDGHPVFVMMPRPADPAFSYLGPEMDELFKARVARVFRTRNLPMLNFTSEAGLQKSDFVDGSHVNATGRSKWSKAFVNNIADYYRSIEHKQ